MRRSWSPLSIAVLAVLLGAAVAAAPLVAEGEAASETEATEEATLYERLGGYDALAAVTDDVIGRLASDESLARFFVGHSTDSLQEIRQLIVDQLCEATGGPCVYTGRSMEDSHGGLGITAADWEATVAHLVATLEKFEVPEKERGEVLALASSLRDSIVEE